MSASLVNVEFLYSDLKRETKIEGMTDMKFSERGAELAQKQCSQAAVLCVWVHRIAVLRAAPLRWKEQHLHWSLISTLVCFFSRALSQGRCQQRKQRQEMKHEYVA